MSDRLDNLIMAIGEPIKLVASGYADKLAINVGADAVSVRRALTRKTHEAYLAVAVFPNRVAVEGEDEPGLEPLFPDMEPEDDQNEDQAPASNNPGNDKRIREDVARASAVAPSVRGRKTRS